MLKKGLWGLLVFCAVVIGLYPTFFFIEEKFGVLGLKPEELLANRFWQLGFYAHIITGGLALLIGWFLFIRRIRSKHLWLHRAVGKVYVISALTASVSGVFIGFYAIGGFISSAGFISLGAGWFYTTLTAYFHIKNKRVNQHEMMMVYSYALCFAAVTLRTWLPLAALLGIEFVAAYKFIAWFSWLPNLLVAYLLTKRRFALRAALAA